MSTDNRHSAKVKKKEEKYMWLGFGNYSGSGMQGPINPGNIRADPSIFDKLFELFGLKKSDKVETKEDSEEERDPNW